MKFVNRLVHQMCSAALLLALGIVSTFSLRGQNLLQNSGFETPQINPSTAFGFEFRVDNELANWSISTPSARGIAHFDTRYHSVGGGNQAIEFEDIGQAIAQSFPTVIGSTYDVSFDLGANVASGQLRVSVGPRTSVIDSGGTNYLRRIITFTADSNVTTLKFEKVTTQLAYPLLDNVSAVLATPDAPFAKIRTSEVEVSWLSASNRSYQVQYRSILTAGAWVDLLSTNISGTGELLSVFDRISLGQPQRYYRIEERGQ